FFFQAEDGIRDATVTGVQTCALPISYVALISGYGCNAPFVNTSPRFRVLPAAPNTATLTDRPRSVREGSTFLVVVFVVSVLLAKIGRASCRDWGDRLACVGCGGGRLL